MPSIAVAVRIDLAEEQPYYSATLAALGHAAGAAARDIDVHVVRTDRLGDGTELPYAGVVIGPGSPYREPEAVLAAIRTAREQGVPLVGT
jgi:CTP synthase (UTP-ammonia lyase)